MKGTGSISTFFLLLITALSLSAADHTTVVSLADLPASGRSQISAALGRDDGTYWAVPDGDALRAQVRGQDLAVRFTPEAVEIACGESRLQMSLRGFGYGEEIRPWSEAGPIADTNRVEYRRSVLTEWYINGPIGLEQGFTIKEPPGNRNGAPLTISMMLTGDLLAHADPRRKSMSLSTPDGMGVLRYGGLSAMDANGMELPAWLEVRGDLLRLRVNDRGATYPIVVDPWIQQAKLSASDGAAFDFFGAAVAMSGNTLVVGSIYHNAAEGQAYVFVKPSSGWTNMTETAKLTASDGAQADYFGFAVAIEGNTVVVGSPCATTNGSCGRGAVYVFVEPAGGWKDMTETAKLTAQHGNVGDGFGISLSLRANTLVVGAPCAPSPGDGLNCGPGAAYVFAKPAGGWKTTAQKAMLLASDGKDNDGFGTVALSGNTIAVAASCAPAKYDGCGPGAAYIFIKPANGWKDVTQNAKLTAAGGHNNDFLGSSLAMDQNTIVAGAPGYPRGKQIGAAYVFVKPRSGWKSTSRFAARLTAAGGRTFDGFGFSTAFDGSTILAGAPCAPAMGNPCGTGLAYLYTKPVTGWKTTSKFDLKLAASDGQTGDGFGSVAMSGKTIVVGADTATVNGNERQGAAYVFGNQ